MKEKIIRRTPLEVYELWIKALESGEYVKTLNALKKVIDPVATKPIIGFCCLGVVCDLAANDGGAQWGVADQQQYFNYMQETIMLPVEIRKFLSLTSEEEADLMGMNDGGASFKHIAKHIRKNIMPAALKRLENQN